MLETSYGLSPCQLCSLVLETGGNLKKIIQINYVTRHCDKCYEDKYRVPLGFKKLEESGTK